MVECPLPSEETSDSASECLGARISSVRKRETYTRSNAVTEVVSRFLTSAGTLIRRSIDPAPEFRRDAYVRTSSC